MTNLTTKQKVTSKPTPNSKREKLEELLCPEPRCSHFLEYGECACFRCSDVLARNGLRLHIKKELSIGGQK